MKRKWLLCVLAAAVFLLAAACGEESTADLSFTNSIDTSVHNLYISDSTADDWGDPVTFARVDSGHTIRINFDRIGEDAGPGNYDIGAINEDRWNFDVYDVPLAVGDQIELSGGVDGATYTVTHADGTADTYEAEVYEDTEEE